MGDFAIMLVGVSVGLATSAIFIGSIYLFSKSIIKSKIDKRICLFAIAICLVVLSIAFNIINNGNIDSVYGYKIKTADFTNGFNEPIGEYTYIEIDKNEMDNDMLLHIYKTDVEDKGYNWFTVKFQDGTGVQFQGCGMYPVYGVLDEEGRVVGDCIDIMPTFGDDESVNGFDLTNMID